MNHVVCPKRDRNFCDSIDLIKITENKWQEIKEHEEFRPMAPEARRRNLTPTFPVEYRLELHSNPLLQPQN